MIYFHVLILISIFINISPLQGAKHVDLPTLLKSVTKLRTKLIGLIGPLSLTEDPDGGPGNHHDNRGRYQHIENNDILDNMEPMPATLDSEDSNEDYYSYEEDNDNCGKFC